MLWRPVGSSLLLRGGKIIVLGLPKGSPILHERTNNLLPPTTLESDARNLRNASNYSQLRIRTSRIKNSPIPYFINLLNQ